MKRAPTFYKESGSFLHFSRMLENINGAVYLKKAGNHNLRDSVLKWFKRCLCGRKQRPKPGKSL